ncbi:hypothetical protein BS297_27210 [Rhodococcus erythropolis]|uniref:CoA transferase n=1 Tax=Rhodococcus erythropolis TaxID=1833 RepID=A0A5N5DYK7_RHOER|nr:hypothetical protein BS297_27210 [Rhodococcus erythropolis]
MGNTQIASQPGDLPLCGVRVVEVTDGSGETASRILADLGADVIRVEQKGSQPSPLEEQREDSLNFYHEAHNANKRGISLDLQLQEQRDTLIRLLQTTDILVEGLGPGGIAGIDPRLDPTRLRSAFPSLVIISISDLEYTGPYIEASATESLHSALGGFMSRPRLPGKEPLLPAVPSVAESAAITAAWAAVIAYYNRLLSGAGDNVYVPILESTAQIIDPRFGMARSAVGSITTSEDHGDHPDASALYPTFLCADGYIRICVLSSQQWAGLSAWMRHPKEFADQAFDDLSARLTAVGTLYPAIRRFLEPKTRSQIVEEGRQFGVPTGALLELSEILREDHFADRTSSAFIETKAGRLRIPNGIMKVNGARAGIRRPAPYPGEHNDEIMKRLPPLYHRPSTGKVVPLVSRRPLDGIRVLELGVRVGEGEAGRLLADMGADVIRVENTAFPDGSRQTNHGEQISTVAASENRNKTSIGINLLDPNGLQLFKDLVVQSDIVLSNFKLRTMDELGLSYTQLAEINPRIIVSDPNVFGSTGPGSDQLGYGPVSQASTGLTFLWKYADPEQFFAIADATTIDPEHTAARATAIGIVAQLIRRRNIGIGGTVTVSHADVIVATTLQNSGVPAEMMHRLPDLIIDPHTRSRQAFHNPTHPLINRSKRTESTPAYFQNVPDVEPRPAPLLGQQTRDIAAKLLGLNPKKISTLLSSGVLRETIPDFAPGVEEGALQFQHLLQHDAEIMYRKSQSTNSDELI